MLQLQQEVKYGLEIGVARARAFGHRSGTDGTSDPLVASASVILHNLIFISLTFV